MKRKAIIISFAVFFILLFNNLNAQLSRQQAINKVVNEIIGEDTVGVNVFSAYNILLTSDSLHLNYDTAISMPYNYNWVFYIDDHPSASWAHPVRYIFVDTSF